MSKKSTQLKLVTDRLIHNGMLDYLLLFLVIILGIYLNWEALEIGILGFVVWFILHPIQSKFLAIISLVCLAASGALIILHRDAKAESMVMLGNLLLILTVVIIMLETRQKRTNKLK